MTDKRIRHCPFIINVTEKDLGKLRCAVEQIKKGDSPSKFKFLIFVKNGIKVYGYSISIGPQYFKTLRNMLSAKATEAEMRLPAKYGW